MGGHRPAHHPATPSIQHHRHVQKPRPRPHVGDVGHPQLIGASGAEVPIDQIRRHAGERAARAWWSSSNACGWRAAIPARRISRPTRFAPIRSPPACNSAWMRGHPYTSRLALQISLIRSRQVRIPSRSCRRNSAHPCVVAAGGETSTQHPTHGAHRPRGLIRLHEPESLPGIESLSRANQAAARFRMSRSVRSCLFSRCSRRSSRRSSVLRPSLRCPPSRSSWATQLRMDPARGLVLPSQLVRRPPRLHQLDHLLAELRWIRLCQCRVKTP